MRMRNMMFVAAAAALAGTPAVAQVSNSQGLIAVNVQDVSILNDFLNNDQIAALNNVPISVQAPISVAAAVCDIPVLASQVKKGSGECNATSGSAALASLVAKQKLNQKVKRNQ